MVRPHLNRVLITGASGTLGYNIVRHLGLRQPGSQLHVLMRTPDATLFSDLPNVILHHVDLANSADMKHSVKEVQPNAILHCAASGVRPSNLSYFEFVELNVSATMQLFQASCDVDRCHFLQVSTGLVYGSQDRPCRENDPVNTFHPYGASKAAADCLLLAGAQRLNRHLTIVRPFSFTGLHDGGDRLFPSLLRAASEGKPFAMSAGTQMRDFCAVGDVVEAIAMILEDGDQPSRDIFNVGSGLSISLGRIVQSVVRQLELDVEVRLGERPFHPLEPAHLVADLSRIRSLGWEPRLNLAYAVWELARAQFPDLILAEPKKSR